MTGQPGHERNKPMTTHLIGLFVDDGKYVSLLTEVEAETPAAALRVVLDDARWGWEQTFGYPDIVHLHVVRTRKTELPEGGSLDHTARRNH